MDKHLEPGKRKRFRRIGNQTASGMPASGNEEPASAIQGRASERLAREAKESHLGIDAVTHAKQGVLNLSTSDVGVEQAQRTDAAEGSVVASHPNSGGLHAPQGRRGQMSDVGKTVKPIGLHRREQALVLTTGKGSS